MHRPPFVVCGGVAVSPAANALWRPLGVGLVFTLNREA